MIQMHIALILAIFSVGIPLLGICYGTQLIVKHFEGSTEKVAERTYSEEQITLDTTSKLFEGQITPQAVWQSNGNHITSLPAGFKHIGN